MMIKPSVTLEQAKALATLISNNQGRDNVPYFNMEQVIYLINNGWVWMWQLALSNPVDRACAGANRLIKKSLGKIGVQPTVSRDIFWDPKTAVNLSRIFRNQKAIRCIHKRRTHPLTIWDMISFQITGRPKPHAGQYEDIVDTVLISAGIILRDKKGRPVFPDRLEQIFRTIV